MSQEPTENHLDSETKTAVTEYAENHDLSTSDALKQLVDTGFNVSNHDPSAGSGENDPTPAQLESRQQAIAHRQQQIVRFQKSTIFGGLGWAVLTLATGSNGPVWIAIGMGIIVLMAVSTYV
ncbi:hypothetical protein [Halonotius pteroides]|uniref:Uncharacterized protein n=1 Tax=Halonotius pteroides TaxID=268735 RepID=A0A3A6Q343_9EURY|nr:hypothetical protein [Halonotius pteroides]RJX51758.1 hypothetical protein DP106_00085 [Halonotius pteroides]